jgi:hypothetical protein
VSNVIVSVQRIVDSFPFITFHFSVFGTVVNSDGRFQDGSGVERLFLCKESWTHFISLLSIFSVFRTVVNSDGRFQDGVVGVARVAMSFSEPVRARPKTAERGSKQLGKHHVTWWGGQFNRGASGVDSFAVTTNAKSNNGDKTIADNNQAWW